MHTPAIGVPRLTSILANLRRYLVTASCARGESVRAAASAGVGHRCARKRDSWVFLSRSLVTAVLFSQSAAADEVLTDENLNAALGRIQQTTEQLDATETGARPANQVFALGREADALAELLSTEVAAHGGLEQPLLDLAIHHAAKLGVHIAWSPGHQRYFYDGAAFRRYLELAPDGEHAAASTFWIVQDDFYRSDAGDIESLLRSSARKQDFLERFGNFPDAPKVALWLGIDFRDLWRGCREHEDADCTERYRELARIQFQELAAAREGSDIGEIARRMLRRFEAELAAAPEHGRGEAITQ